jgi:hypothetical protein
MYALDLCFNEEDSLYTSNYILETLVTLTIGIDSPMAKSTSEWMQEAIVLAHKTAGPCINLTSCSDYTMDRDIHFVAQEIMSELALELELLYPGIKCHPDTLGIVELECLPSNGNWWGSVYFEDLLRENEFIDSDYNDIVMKLRVCFARDYDLTTHHVWSENILFAKGSFFGNHTIKLTVDGTFENTYPQLTYVDPDPLLTYGADYSITRKYNGDRSPTNNGWNETSQIITLLDNSRNIMEPIVLNPTKFQRIVNTNPSMIQRCPRYFTHTIIYPNSSAPPPINIFLSAPPVYLTSTLGTYRASVMALEERLGNSSTVFNSYDFGASFLNITTGFYLETTCFPFSAERNSIFDSYPSFINYSNWLNSNGSSTCLEDSSCYEWYNNPNTLFTYNDFEMLDSYGICY